MKRFLRYTAHIFAMIFATLALWTSNPAHAEFVLSPLRQVVTLENPKVTYEISNPSTRTIVTNISWIDLKAVETGYVAAPPNLRDKLSAAPYLIVSPTYIRLEPGARETITISLRGGASPPKGERRSHLLIESKAVRTLLRKAGSGIQLDLDTAVSTPVLLRSGERQTKAKIGDTRLLRNKDGGMDIETRVESRGDHSAYGYVAAYFKSNKPGSSEKELARIDNIAAYLEAKQRKVIFPLNVKRLDEGVFTVRYIGSAEYSEILFDERAFQVSPPGG